MAGRSDNPLRDTAQSANSLRDTDMNNLQGKVIRAALAASMRRRVARRAALAC